MDCFNILSIIILVVLSLATFKYPTELYLQARCDNESKKFRVFYYLIAIFYIVMGIYAMSEVAISIMILCLDIENPMHVLVYAIAFMVEVIGNFLYIKIRYGGISQLLEIEIDYVDEFEDDAEYDDYYEDEFVDCDDEDEDDDDNRKDYGKVIYIEDYMKKRKKWSKESTKVKTFVLFLLWKKV